MRLTFLILGLFVSLACLAQAKKPYQWTQFVQVEGQPEPVPAEWVSTPGGKFAHSIKIPNPVPKDSGYRWTMSANDYFEHLCKQEAGEFIFKKVKNVEGFYFARPPTRPTDDDLKDRRKLEAPEIERTFQLLEAFPQERAKMFVNPPWSLYSFVEEPTSAGTTKTYVRLFGYEQKVSPMSAVDVRELKSRYGLIWRGIKRHKDREHAIAGSEWIVFDLVTKESLAVVRNYGRTGNTRGAPEGIWWLNAVRCPSSASQNNLPDWIYELVSKVLLPGKGDLK